MMDKKFRLNKGSGLGVLYMGLSIALLGLFVFFYIVDYSIYTYKYFRISNAMNEAVCAASLCVDEASQGLEAAFDDEKGTLQLNNVKIMAEEADKIFVAMMKENSKLDFIDYKNQLITLITEVSVAGLDYSVRKAGIAGDCLINEMGTVVRPEDLEGLINRYSQSLYLSGSMARSEIYVNENKATNKFEQRPYYMAYIKNLEIDGLFSKRSADFSAFKAAKISRRK